MKLRTRTRPCRGKAFSRKSLLLIFPLVLVLVASCVAGEAIAHSIPFSVFGNGGSKIRNGVHIVNGTIGQPLVGNSSTQTFMVASGAWHDTCGVLWTGVSDEPGRSSGLPARYSLSQNYPNPFNPTTTIQFSLPEQSRVTLKLYNILGEMVAELVDEDLSPGDHRVTVSADNLASGIYFYRLTARDFVRTKKLVLLK